MLESEWLGVKEKHRFRHIESGKEYDGRPADLTRQGFPKDLRSEQDKFEQLRQLAQDSGFEMLESEWLGVKEKHRFRHIESGKELEWRPRQLFRQGFPKDLRSEQDKFEQLRQLAQDSGFEMLESEWLGSHSKHRFRHIESGKEREWVPSNLFSQGFPEDLRTERDRFEQLRQLAKDNGFELLETQWLGALTKHRFRHIESGMEMEWTPAQLFSRGCPKDLRSDQDRFEQLRQLAQDNGFELLEMQWLGTVTKHRFRHIESGKEREWVPKNLFSRGFPEDIRTDQDRFEQLRQLAQDNGFELLETEWLGAATKHRFRHIESVKEREWAPAQLFSDGFPKDLRTDQDRFEQLRQLASDSGFELLETQWLGASTKHRFRHIESGREREWRPTDLVSPKGFLKDLRTEYLRTEGLRTERGRFEEALQKLKKFAQDNGYELLETEWLGALTKHRFRHIESGREREWRPTDLTTRQGFPKDRFEQLRQLAEDNGYELLETEWLGTDNKHRFRHIESGKPYKGPPSNLFRQGFPKDIHSFRHISGEDKLEQLRQLAQDNGFELLEMQWLGTVTKHRFRHIESGKEYDGRPTDLTRHGFPKDLRNLRTPQDRFEELKQLAQDNGFELLETEWLGNATKHRFRHIESGRLYEGPPARLRLRGFPEKTRKQDPLPSENSSSNRVRGNARPEQRQQRQRSGRSSSSASDPNKTAPAAPAIQPGWWWIPSMRDRPSMDAPPDEDDEAGTAAPTPAP